ncbi:MAG TPA: D-hexose-6-phosphate mutarotase [bacterium]|nr:D-hexose-6-phosphate mutarotase [bacterium]HQG46621.1 D-hexose-6-phosphate mutarotase [bacterium]HQI49845.1 D-hexose-6-phosphate mutarotase [bacterium]HQJ64884.1 D-hexose-6-phosphate mutarotase [bacterium]
MNSSEDPATRPLSGKGGLPMLEVVNGQAKALISLYGGQVLSWVPRGEEEVLFLSERSHFTAGQPIRGGVPICWPWFGPHPADPAKPMHGFARLMTWRLTSSATLPSGASRIELMLTESPETLALWPQPFRLLLHIDVGSHLRIALTMVNSGPEPLATTSALHSYFRLGKAGQVHITGLDDTFYIDTLQQDLYTLQRGKLQVDQEINRIYLDTASLCMIHDPLLERQIVVKKEGSRSTVVWNPWSERSRGMADLGPDEYQYMVCIEAGNVRQDGRTLAPGASHTLVTEFAVIH